MKVLGTILLGVFGIVELITLAYKSSNSGEKVHLLRVLMMIGIICALPIVNIWLPSLTLNIITTSVIGVMILYSWFALVAENTDHLALYIIGVPIFFAAIYAIPIISIWTSL